MLSKGTSDVRLHDQRCQTTFWIMLHHLLSLQVKSVFPLAMIHVLGNVLTNISLGLVAVSFTHTVKVGGAWCVMECMMHYVVHGDNP
jgi:hypothetical protein